MRAGKVIAPIEVLLELERGGDELYNWVKAREFIFIEPDEKIQEVVVQIMNQYPNFPPPSFSSDGVWADPYVIALAKVKKAIVITGEIPADPKAKKIKMPDVCMKMGIEWANFLQFIRREGWRF